MANLKIIYNVQIFIYLTKAINLDYGDVICLVNYLGVDMLRTLVLG